MLWKLNELAFCSSSKNPQSKEAVALGSGFGRLVLGV